MELTHAAYVGVARRVVSLRQKNNQNKHALRSDWATDIDGAAAECAFSKWSGMYWEPSVNTFKAPDVGHIQVRSTNHDAGHLIVRDNDSANEMFVLMVGKYASWRLAGWMFGMDAKVGRYWRKGENGEASAFWVPQPDLNPMSDLEFRLSPPRQSS